MHQAIASHLRKSSELAVRTATLDEPEHGLRRRCWRETDVTWWGHTAPRDVKDENCRACSTVSCRAWGIVVLHSGHFSKIFRKLMAPRNLAREAEYFAKSRGSLGQDIRSWRESTIIHHPKMRRFFDIPNLSAPS
jgi:trehalose utilization protein